MTEYNKNFIQTKMEQIFSHTCGSFENCTEANIQTFLTQCYEENIDPQYCLSWVSEHNAKIPNWNNVSRMSQEWINGHTSTGSTFSLNLDDEMHFGKS
jgi:hypothetical protein